MSSKARVQASWPIGLQSTAVLLGCLFFAVLIGCIDEIRGDIAVHQYTTNTTAVDWSKSFIGRNRACWFYWHCSNYYGIAVLCTGAVTDRIEVDFRTKEEDLRDLFRAQ